VEDPCNGNGLTVGDGVVESCDEIIPHGDGCVLTCNDGYDASGDGMLKCETGVFDVETCEPKDCNTQNLDIAHGSHDCGVEKQHGDTCTLTCTEAGFELTGDGILTCDKGTMSRGGSACGAAPCDTSGLQIEHGAHDCSDTVDSGSSCTLRCDRGYYVKDTPPPRRLDRESTADIGCEAGDFDQDVPRRAKACIPRPCFPSNPSLLVIENQRIHNGGDRSNSRLEYNGTCELFCKDGYTPSGEGNLTGIMTCGASELGVLHTQTCDMMPCGPGQEAVGSTCAPCKPDFYSPAGPGLTGQPCLRCPANSQPSADSTYCRCQESYYYDHWTPGLRADFVCKECVSGTLCRTLKNGTMELTMVEGIGGYR
jgi:hypothetical protein